MGWKKSICIGIIGDIHRILFEQTGTGYGNRKSHFSQSIQQTTEVLKTEWNPMIIDYK